MQDFSGGSVMLRFALAPGECNPRRKGLRVGMRAAGLSYVTYARPLRTINRREVMTRLNPAPGPNRTTQHGRFDLLLRHLDAGVTLDNMADHTRMPHAQPRRLITTTTNNDNLDSTLQVSKSRKLVQRTHKSCMRSLILARRPDHSPRD